MSFSYSFFVDKEEKIRKIVDSLSDELSQQAPVEVLYKIEGNEKLLLVKRVEEINDKLILGLFRNSKISKIKIVVENLVLKLIFFGELNIEARDVINLFFAFSGRIYRIYLKEVEKYFIISANVLPEEAYIIGIDKYFINSSWRKKRIRLSSNPKLITLFWSKYTFSVAELCFLYYKPEKEKR